MNQEKIEKGKELIKELSSILKELSDIEVGVLGTGILNDLIPAIFDASYIKKGEKVGDFFLANKMRTTIVALIHYRITKNCSIKLHKYGLNSFVSPYLGQWYDDGVMFITGKNPFEGTMSLWRNGEEKIMILNRDIGPGEEFGPAAVTFISIEEANKRFKTVLEKMDDLNKPLYKLQNLLDSKETLEGEYQKVLKEYPWILGLKYKSIGRHIRLDDKNIPDFIGAKCWDGYRDIIEIKPPFINLFRQNGEFTAEFSNYWNQVEDYLVFVRENKDYLRNNKGLIFDNPRCLFVRLK